MIKLRVLPAAFVLAAFCASAAQATQISLEKFKEFVSTNSPVYATGEHSIQFLSFVSAGQSYGKGYFSLRHNPWKQPGIYNDSDPSKALCDIRDGWADDSHWHISCDSDDYSTELYLKIKVIDETQLEVVYPRSNPPMILERIAESSGKSKAE